MMMPRAPRNPDDLIHIPKPPEPPAPVEPTIEEVRALRIAQINATAGHVILSRYPEHTQRNMLARAIQLTADGKDQSDEARALRKSWQWIEAVRAHAASLRAAVETSDNPAPVTLEGWPE